MELSLYLVQGKATPPVRYVSAMRLFRELPELPGSIYIYIAIRSDTEFESTREQTNTPKL